MTAQPIHAQPAPPRITRTVRDIRRHLPPDLREQFQAEIDDAVDTGDMGAVDQVKLGWWGRALIETDPHLKADLTASVGNLEWHPSPFPR